MAVESLRLWKELERETSQELLIPAGLLMLEGDDEHANRFNESSFRMLTKLELGAHIYDGQELKMHFPQFQAGSAFFDPHGGVLLAAKGLEAFASEAGRRGVKILEKHVTKVRDKSGLEIATAKGQT